ncbi:hypothetical protein OSTOST_16381 [Ostertagia ostertagi]
MCPVFQGTLPVMRDTENRTSDDSGLTSDDTSERRQLGASVIETSTPRQQRKPIERDSLNSYADDYEFDVEDEIFDEIASPADRDGNVKYNGYVNLSDFVAIRDESNSYTDIVKTPADRPLCQSIGQRLGSRDCFTWRPSACQ